LINTDLTTLYIISPCSGKLNKQKNEQNITIRELQINQRYKTTWGNQTEGHALIVAQQK